MKIAFCIEKFSNKGGMERVLSCIVNSLSKSFDISVITAYQGKESNAFGLSNDIEIYDLGVCTGFKTHHIYYNPMMLDYKKKLKVYLCNHHYDFVISMGGLDLYFLPQINDGSVKLAWFHFNFNVFYSFCNRNSIYCKIVAWALTQRRILSAKRFDGIITISKSEQRLWRKHCKNVECIYNPLAIRVNKTTSHSVKSAIAVGRLDYVKGFDLLIEAWNKVAQIHNDWKLDIYGEGSQRDSLVKKIGVVNYGYDMAIKNLNVNLLINDIIIRLGE